MDGFFLIMSNYLCSYYSYSTEVNTVNNTNVTTEVGYDFTAHVTTENCNTGTITEDNYNYSVEYNDSYNSNLMTEATEGGINNYYYQQRSVHFKKM